MKNIKIKDIISFVIICSVAMFIVVELFSLIGIKVL